MGEPMRDRAEWVDMRSIRRLVDRVVRSPRLPPESWWPDRADRVLGAHWALADHEWHRRRTRLEGGAELEELDDHATRYALLPDGRLVRADRTRSVEGGVGGAWRSDVRTLTARDVLALDRRPVTTAAEHGATSTWGTRPTGEPFLPGRAAVWSCC
ncbi:hypothetical protein [Amnibacterium kyonggiense]